MDELAGQLLTESYPPSAGGQHVGSSRGLKVTHIPSGLIVICDTERSQHRNLAIAKDMIMGGLTSPYYRNQL